MEKRILVVNKFYYPRGGDCVCTINLESLLKSNGYRVAVYSMNYHDNIKSDYQNYFAPEVSFNGGISNKIDAVKRVLGLGDIKDSFEEILEDFHPDIVHFNNIHSYLSPVIVKMAHDSGAKVVWTLHDYKLLCPSYDCLRNGKPCELCFNDKSNVLSNRCMKGSLVASLIAYLEAKKWNRKSLEQWTDAFVCPSQFMADKMASGGFNKINVICNFVDPVKLSILQQLPTTNRKDYFVYVGRLSKEKGVDTLLEAATKADKHIKIAGAGPLKDILVEKYKNNKNIEFLGHLNAQEVSDTLANAKFSIIPSEWYENNPLSVIESLCAGTPVVGTNIGGIPELLDSDNGIIAEPCNSDNLAVAINQAFERNWDYAKIKENAISRFSPDTHLHKLEGIYNSI
ncbi:MAG: glycosyltransferase [Muribaculaceae bacterium]|nr:glycosyltransferase [Muribaculaceae bacterium]